MLALVLGCLLSGPWGCRSAAERCREERSTAQAQWDAYLAALTQAREQAEQARAAAVGSLEREWKPKLEREARAKADRLNRPDTTEWWRTYAAASQALCSDHPECAAQKTARAQAEQRMAELDRRLGAVRSARTALDGRDVQAAREALQAVQDDFDRKPLLSTAREQGRRFIEACATQPEG